jgi:hypothetical protein
MGAQKTPGPLGSEGTSLKPDAGILQRAATPLPGPIRIAFGDSSATRDLRVDQERKPARPDAKAEAAPQPEDRVLTALAKWTRDFVFSGSRFRLIPTRDWHDVRRGERYQVVHPNEAKPILENLAVNASNTEKAAFLEAVSMLPLQAGVAHSKVLLLRGVVHRISSSTSSEPALTPSQIARSVREQHWVEIELVGEDGVGISGEEYLIVTSDKQQYSGVTDADGVVRVENVLPGECKISFPKLDRDAWRAA